MRCQPTVAAEGKAALHHAFSRAAQHQEGSEGMGAILEGAGEQGHAVPHCKHVLPGGSGLHRSTYVLMTAKAGVAAFNSQKGGEISHLGRPPPHGHGPTEGQRRVCLHALW